MMARDWNFWPGAELWYGFGWFVQPTANFVNDVIAQLNAGLGQVQRWPSGDLFPQYDPPAA